MADNISQGIGAGSEVYGSFRTVTRTKDHAPFRNLPGWKFDEGLWASLDQTNSLFTLPLASDLDLSRVPDSYFKSGIGLGSSIELDEINFLDEGFVLGWTPGVIRGDYWVHRHSDYLHSSESILALPTNDVIFFYLPDTDPGTVDENSIRSFVNLEHVPSYTIPIMIKYLERDGNLAIKQQASFTQVSKFTGFASAGIEQDGDDYNNTDKTKLEFKLIKNDSDPRLNIPVILNANAVIQGSVLRISLGDEIPVPTWRAKFSRLDIFKRELPFSVWNEARANPAQSLTVGDYTIGYQGSSGEGTGVWLWKGDTTLPDNLGTISYQANKPVRLLFNQDIRVAHELVELTNSIAGNDGLTYFLPQFPVLDLSTFRDESLIGDLILDTVSVKIYVDAIEWTRVASLEEVALEDDQHVFELNPLWGIIRFGNSGNGDIPLYGDRPDGTVTATWIAVPYIRYDKKDSTMIFSDPSEDLDPMTNAMKQGFLVLDNRRLTPWKIELTTSSPSERNELGVIYHGKLVENTLVGLGVPPTSEADITMLRARVIAFGNPIQGVPNIPVEFVSLDGLLSFAQSAAVTDGDGYAYTEAFGKSNFNEFVLKVHLFNPTDEPILNPSSNDLELAFTPLDPIITDRAPEAGPVWAGEGVEWTNNALIVTEQVDEALSDIYLFIVSTPGATTTEDYDDDPMNPDEYLTPYNSMTRDGGLAKVWSYQSDNAQEIVHPVEVIQISNNQAILVFDRELPSGKLVMGYRIVIDRTSRVFAQTVESPILRSNELSYYLALNETMRDQWKLPNLHGSAADGFHQEDPEAEDIDGSRIGTATYISHNDYNLSEFRNEANEVIEQGSSTMVLLIKGEGFNQTGRSPSVYIIKTNNDGTISSLKDITSATTIVDTNTIRVGSLPTPPTGNPGDYYIAVSSFSERTSKLFTYVG